MTKAQIEASLNFSAETLAQAEETRQRMEKKHTPTVYHCKTRTEATDRANLYYIASPTARRIETTAQSIRIYGKKPAPLAVFEF